MRAKHLLSWTSLIPLYLQVFLVVTTLKGRQTCGDIRDMCTLLVFKETHCLSFAVKLVVSRKQETRHRASLPLGKKQVCLAPHRTPK